MGAWNTSASLEYKDRECGYLCSNFFHSIFTPWRKLRKKNFWKQISFKYEPEEITRSATAPKLGYPQTTENFHWFQKANENGQFSMQFSIWFMKTLCSKKVFQGPEGGKIKTVIKYFGASFVCNLSKLFELCDINQQPFCFGAALWFEENK